jgi:hyaluronan synthase
MAIDALIKQTYKIHEIIFVDDCSVDTSAYEGVCAFIKDHQGSYNGTKLVAHRQANQAGKRHAQIWGFKRATGDLLLLADSDGYLLPDAIEELVKVFSDEKVGSVVGYIGARNAKKNFLTAMQDMSYCSAFHVGRASQSMTNSVVVCSGALSMHRRHIVLEHLDEFGKEWVLKIHVKNGDDRRLTVISRKNGWKTKYQSTAVCYTDVPDTTDKFIKQRIRWSRSTYLCSIQNLITKPWKYLIYVIHSFLEAYLWLITFLVWFLFPRELNPTWAWGVQAFVYYILMCYISKVYYLFQNPIKYILSPIYSLVYGILTIYIRIRTFLVLFNYGWGTR